MHSKYVILDLVYLIAWAADVSYITSSAIYLGYKDLLDSQQSYSYLLEVQCIIMVLMNLLYCIAYRRYNTVILNHERLYEPV